MVGPWQLPHHQVDGRLSPPSRGRGRPRGSVGRAMGGGGRDDGSHTVGSPEKRKRGAKKGLDKLVDNIGSAL